MAVCSGPFSDPPGGGARGWEQGVWHGVASSGPSGVIIWVEEAGCVGGKRAGRRVTY
jgi:hypothetical protein